MAEWGGKRTPRNPAAVSGPGRLSRRTDGGPQQTTTPMTGLGYGENADFNDIQSSAPLAAASSAPRAGVRRQASGSAAPSVSPLFAPTARPDEPVTAGAPVGPGPGPSGFPALPAAGARPTMSSTLGRIFSTTNDPRVARLLAIAERRGW